MSVKIAVPDKMNDLFFHIQNFLKYIIIYFNLLADSGFWNKLNFAITVTNTLPNNLEMKFSTFQKKS